MANQVDRNLSEALVKFGRDQGQMLALHKGEGWEGMLKEMLRITEHKHTAGDQACAGAGGEGCHCNAWTLK